jgi:2,3-bisphosphoglycerate-independent phosphoglycerate mutase
VVDDGAIAARDGVIAARPVDVLVILDGASEPLGEAPTSLERARTPVLDQLAAEGTVTTLRTVPLGLPIGSESAIPGLLGWVPDAPVDRGAIEAAAHGIELREGERAWRVDRRDRADASASAHALERVLARRLPRRRGFGDRRVHHVGGHRMVIVGPEPASTLGGELFEIELRAGLLGRELLVWPEGVIPERVLDEDTVVIGARGAAVGIGRLMGARTVVPPRATGRPGSDLAAKAAAALTAIGLGDGRSLLGGGDVASRVIVHVGAPDEAAHECDADAKVSAIEAADRLLLAPLADALRAHGGTLQVCPDHGCDPATGAHDGAPVPCLQWPAANASGGRLTERTAANASGGRLTERTAALWSTEPVVAA